MENQRKKIDGFNYLIPKQSKIIGIAIETKENYDLIIKEGVLDGSKI